MRIGIVFGLITLFALISFVPPQGGTSAVVQAQEITLRLNTQAVTSALDSVKNQGDLFVKNIVPVVKQQVPKINAEIPSDINIDISDPTQSVKNAAPSLIKRLITFAADEVQKQVQITAPDSVPADWRRAAEDETNETLKQHFLLIEWAREKHDIRACNELKPTVLEERVSGDQTFQTPAPGDWIAYCLARVTQSADRCLQIDSAVLPPLRALCEQEIQ